MKKEIYTFKTEISKFIDQEKMKIWLAKRQGKRVEYIFKLGTEQFKSAKKIVVEGDYILFGQNLTDSCCKKIEKIFERYFR